MIENLRLSVGVLFLTGLIGSLGHCMGMCGPLVMMVATRLPVQRHRVVLLNFLVYHGARIAVYMLFGFIVGTLGSFLKLGQNASTLGGIIGLILGTLVILTGLSRTHLLPVMGRWNVSRWVGDRIGALLRKGSAWRMAPLGALNGLLPCGLVYSSLLVVSAWGNSAQSSLGMLTFGLGTLPALLIVGMGARFVSPAFRQRMSWVATSLILLLGVQIILRGSAALGVVGHAHIGGVVFW